MSEYEIIHYPQVDGINLLFDTVEYRTAHAHPEWELIWVVEQPLWVTCRQQELLAAEDSVLLLPPNLSHQFRKQEVGSTILFLQISPRCFQISFPELKYLTIQELFADPFWSPEQRRTSRRLFLELAEAYFDRPPCYQLTVHARAAELLQLSLTCMPVIQNSPPQLQEQERKHAQLARLLAYVDEHYTGKIRLQDFADQEHCSLSQMSRFVREMLNQTFQDYVDTVRFNAACKRIASGETRMVDVYLASGFSDYRYFTRAFRRRTGKTPEEYAREVPAETSAHIHIHQSIHSLERFYSREECRRKTEELKAKLDGANGLDAVSR